MNNNIISEDVLDSKYGKSYSNLSEDGPNLILGTGVGGEYTPATSLSGNTATGWDEVQWGAPGYFQPTDYSTAHTDSNFGKALGYWYAGDSQNYSDYAVYGTQGNYIYQMGGYDTSSAYSNNIFIQTQYNMNYSFSNQITFTANEGISNVIGKNNAFMIDNAFTVQYKNGSFIRDFFLQVQISDSRGQPSSYSTIAYGANGGQYIYNVTDTAGANGNTTATEYLPWEYSNGLHTVTINVNEALLAMANAFVNAGTGQSSSDILNMNNWTLGGSYFGIEAGSGDSAQFYLQDASVHYDTSTSFSSSDTNKSVVSIQGIGYQDIKYNVSSLSDTSTDITIKGNQQTIYNGMNASTPNVQKLVLNGIWDTVNVQSYSLIAYVNKGASFTSNGGVLTESGIGNTYVAGTYNGLYLTLSGPSEVNAILNGYGAINASGDNVTIVGKDAGFTLSGNAHSTLVGDFSLGLTDYNFTDGDIYASCDKNSLLTNNGGNLNLTVNGNLALQNNAGSTNILGVGAGTLSIEGSNSGNINGDWQTITGSVSDTLNVTVKDANIENQSGSVSITGTNGDLNYSGNGIANIVGIWNSVNAVLGSNQYFNSIVGDNSNITIASGATASIWNQTASNVSIAQNGGSSDITLGTGYTDINVDMNSDATVHIQNFSTSHTLLLLTNLPDSGVSIQQLGLDTLISSKGMSGTVILDNTNSSSISGISSVGTTIFSQQTGTNTLAVI